MTAKKNNTMKEITKNQDEMEEELKNEYIDILTNFYNRCKEMDSVCKVSIFKASIGNMLMCFKKADSLYISGKEVVWCQENSVKETHAYNYLKKALIRVENEILDENKFDKDDVYFYIKDEYIFSTALDYVCDCSI